VSESSIDAKLDPRLAALVEAARSGAPEAAERVDVLVALVAPMDDAVRADLESRGLAVRSEVGTVCTASVTVEDAMRVAASPHVLTIEASAPLYAEPESRHTDPSAEPDSGWGEGPA